MADKTYRNSKDKYLKEKVDTFVLRVPKGKKDEIAEHAKKLGLSLNSYVTSLIFADMGVDITAKKNNYAEKESTKKDFTKATANQHSEELTDTSKIEKNNIEQTEETKKKKMPSFLL